MGERPSGTLGTGPSVIGAVGVDDHGQPEPPADQELAHEQAYVSMLYDRLDRLRERIRAQLDEAQRQEPGGTHQARLDRDAFVASHAERLARLAGAENRLCFGRLDHRDGLRLYIGRLGLLDDEYEPLLVDWRAPAAQPFYRATPAAPLGVVRRRHLRTKGRAVVAIDDDVLDLDALSDAERGRLGGEAALLAALRERRTGRMGDIVATIQAEQDRVIRSDLRGVLVVEGGPGTGKTAVALHRAAYLLYTHRDRLARRGVLVVGPNPTFLRYIEEVLPSLGETGVLLATVDRLYPGVVAGGREDNDVATVKGDARMAAVLAAAVRDRQRVPRHTVEVVVDGQKLRLDPEVCERARERAWDSHLPHNEARRGFVRAVLTPLARQFADRVGHDLLGQDVVSGDLRALRRQLSAEPAVRSVLDRLWPHLTPEQLVIDLFTSADRLAAAAPGLRATERALLRRRRPSDRGPEAMARWWTPADVPLLDEAAELLGQGSVAAGPRARRRADAEQRELAYARDVLEVFGVGGSGVDPAMVAGRYGEGGPFATVADRARQDRTWTFGHVIVDEAQELSAMAWRMLMRRCPSRSMTVVGDLAQTGAPWGAASWAAVLDPYAAGRWRQEELTVNYRTPAEIMAVAADVLASIDPDRTPPSSVRDTGTPPWRLRIDPADLAAALPGVVAAESEAVGDGRLAVLAPARRVGGLGRLLAAALPTASGEQGPSALDARIAVLTVAGAKGLEFDGVVVVDPAGILDEDAHGGTDLYVALTRSTQRLGVVHLGELPPVLARLTERPPPL